MENEITISSEIQRVDKIDFNDYLRKGEKLARREKLLLGVEDFANSRIFCVINGFQDNGNFVQFRDFAILKETLKHRKYYEQDRGKEAEKE